MRFCDYYWGKNILFHILFTYTINNSMYNNIKLGVNS